ncbi:MAG: putative Ig domain-containing protein [Isosphaeraceae bacterium]
MAIWSWGRATSDGQSYGRRGRSRRSPSRSSRPALLEILEDRLCLTGALSLSLSSLTGTVGSPFTAQIGVSGGAPGDTYSYALGISAGDPANQGLPVGLSLSANSPTISGTPTQPGAFPIIVEVTDNTTGVTAQEAFPLSIAPTITLSGSLPAGTEYSAYQAAITVDGPAGDTYTISPSGNLPPGLSLSTTAPNNTVELTGTPTQWGTYTFTVTATAGDQSTGEKVYTVTIAPDISFRLDTNPAKPVPALAGVISDPGQTDTLFNNNLPVATLGQAYDQTILATSANGVSAIDISSTSSGVIQSSGNPTVLTWNGLTLQSQSGTITITGTPTSDTSSTSPLVFTFTAVDGTASHNSDQIAYQLEVQPGTAAPTAPIEAKVGGVDLTSLPAATVGQPYNPATFEIPGFNVTGLAFSALAPPNVAAVPSGMEVNNSVLSGTPTAAGFYSLTVQGLVTPPAGSGLQPYVVDSRVFTLTVEPAPNALGVSPLALPLASPGVPYYQTIIASGGPDVTLSNVTDSSTIQTLNSIGLTITPDPNNPAALIVKGTPTGSMKGIDLMVQASNGSASPPPAQEIPLSVAYTPQQIRKAYGFDQIALNGGVVGNGSGQTVAIIDGGDSPNIVSSTDPNFAYSDLHSFDVQFGLPDPPEFLKLDAFGGTNLPINTNSSKQNPEGEITQDVEWVHALAPDARIILLEGDPYTALQTARSIPGVSIVSMSLTFFRENYPASQVQNETSLDSVFQSPAGHPMTFFAAAGDANPNKPLIGYGVSYPAVSPEVVGVGYTHMTLNAQGGYGSEAVVAASGGGASVQQPQPGYQAATAQAGETMRTLPDVTFNGAPLTGVVTYNSFNESTGNPFGLGDGTSIATPSWAALMAIIDQGLALTGQSPLDGASQVLPDLYRLAGTDAFHQVNAIADPQSNQAGTLISPAFGSYNPWAGLGSPVANLLVPDLVGGANTISGTVFKNNDGSGKPDANNPGIAKVTVYLDVNNEGQFVPGDASTVTGPGGSYSFTVAPGTYAVRVVVPSGKAQTTPDPTFVSFPVGSPASRTGVDFGLQQLPAPTPTPTPTPPPAPTPSPTPTPTPAPVVVTVPRTPHRTPGHALRLQLHFSTALNPGAAVARRNYKVTQPGRFRRSHPRSIVIRAVRYDLSTGMVTLRLGTFRPRLPLRLTVNGLVAANMPTTTTVINLRRHGGPRFASPGTPTWIAT